MDSTQGIIRPSLDAYCISVTSRPPIDSVFPEGVIAPGLFCICRSFSRHRAAFLIINLTIAVGVKSLNQRLLGSCSIRTLLGHGNGTQQTHGDYNPAEIGHVVHGHFSPLRIQVCVNGYYSTKGSG
ncbi:MAG UNVERIFIED_CONTAM: hypothetical protein LVR18_35970 [Planctomycetaceae bacterium]|jgi:hypothetical protein